MSGRRNVKPEPNILVRGEYRGYPPRCEQCGWTGVATQEASPYLNCVRDTDEDLDPDEVSEVHAPWPSRSRR